MQKEDPTTWSTGFWLLALCMPVIGGVINWYTKIRDNKTRAFNLVELIGEVTIAGFTGVAIFMLLIGLDQPIVVCAALSGIGGHMATRVLFLIESIIEHKLSKLMSQESKESI